jgi:hypothetical protein
MCGGTIEWTAFTWEAFATLVTGILAVIAAVVIGVRQSGIASAQTDIAGRQADIAGRQAEILQKQVALDELKLRADLFEKRFAVYDATRHILSQAIQDSKRPARGDERETAFLIAKDQATFLFRPSVSDDLHSIWMSICASQAVRAEMDANFARDRDYGEGLPEKQLNHSLWQAERLRTLSDVFGDELKLTHAA